MCNLAASLLRKGISPLAPICYSLLLLLPLCVAVDHIVGANHGWQLPANAGQSVNLNYTVWAASQTFIVGDDITFHYQEGVHSVFQVNYSVYTNCTLSMYSGHDWIYNWTAKNGRTVVPLNESKMYYFACGIDNHCQQGMKVAVNVTKNTTAATATQSSSEKKHSAAASNTVLLSTLLVAEALLFVIVSLLYPEL